MLARLFPAAPALIAASFVLTVFADSGYTLDSLIRPLVIAILAVVVLQLIVSAATRSVTIGSIVTSIVAGTVIDLRFAALSVVAVAVAAYARRSARPVPVERVVVVPLILFAISAGRAVTSDGFVIDDLFPGNNIRVDATDTGERPDVYVVLLDGYPRADTLLSVGIDNGDFIEALADRGFSVAPRSHGNYPFTTQVITSMLSMVQLPDVDDLSPPPDTPSGQMRAISNVIRQSPAVETFDRHGYRTLSTGLPGDPTTLRGVDEYLDPGMMTVFEHQVLRRTVLWDVLEQPLTIPQLRSQIRQTFDIVAQVASSDHDEPVFLFAHVMSPHTPFIFDANGEVPQLSCEPDCERWTIFAAAIPLPDDEYWARYADQLAAVNAMALDAVDAILEADPGAVVILLSDHGSRASPNDLDEWYRTFFAARTPGHADLFGDEARAIEVFPRILSAYLGEDVAIAPDVTYRFRDNPTAGLHRQLELVEITVDSLESPIGERSSSTP